MELPPSITYLGSRLIVYPRSGVWVVVITEWVARLAAFHIVGRLRHISIVVHPTSYTRLREKMDLSFVLGSREIEGEFRRMIATVKEIDWERVPANQHKRGNGRDRHCLGRTRPSGDFVWYDPFQDEVIPEEKAAKLRRFPRKIPEGYPRGYDFELARMTGSARSSRRRADAARNTAGSCISPKE